MLCWNHEKLISRSKEGISRFLNDLPEPDFCWFSYRSLMLVSHVLHFFLFFFHIFEKAYQSGKIYLNPTKYRRHNALFYSRVQLTLVLRSSLWLQAGFLHNGTYYHCLSAALHLSFHFAKINLFSVLRVTARSKCQCW